MSNIKDFHNTKINKLNKQTEELDKAHEEASTELDALLHRMDMKNNNGKENTEEEMLELFAAMGKVARTSELLHEAHISYSTYKSIMDDVNIEDEVKKVMHGDVIPTFVPEDELDPYFK